MTRLTHSVLSIVLESLDQSPLPDTTPGAHIDLHLDQGLTRSYSIVGQDGHSSRYEIAVALDPNSRGGSHRVHHRLRVGDEIDVAGPRNLFKLYPNAVHSFLIAGGIGITPIWSMVQELEQQHKAWTLCFAARSRAHAAYLEEIEALGQRSLCGRVLTHFDDEHDGFHLDLTALLETVPDDAHLYCCGPAPLLTAYELATQNRPADHVHLERFTNHSISDASANIAFEVVLARSGQTLQIPANRTILDVMLDSGIDAPFGCMQGVCGMCAVPLLEGIPDHRDNILSTSDKQSNASVIVCCSRSLTASLTIDI